jgi:hypothetical protein
MAISFIGDSPQFYNVSLILVEIKTNEKTKKEFLSIFSVDNLD